jgi:GrpB-like predicted nucleotidyltransferase (UPF0157 family)
MPGKGYVDLHLSVPPPHLPAAVEALLSAGWQRQVEAWRFPDARPMLRAAVTRAETRYQAHLHLLPEGSRELETHLAFRDALRAGAALRDRYAARKRELVAAGTTDGADYAAAKSGVIEEALHALGFGTSA